jgi:hypothetical protein
MVGIKSLGNIFWGGKKEPDPPVVPMLNHPESIEIPDYDNVQGMQNDIEKFKNDVASFLNTAIDNIEIIQEKSGLKARLKDTQKEIPIYFKDKVDLSRMAKYAILSSSLNLINFGDDKPGKRIKIVDYEDGLSRDSQIQLFKDDISREAKTDRKFLEIHVIDNNLIVRKKDSKETFLIEFADPADFERFLGYAKETKSKRLDDFGVRKTEATVSIGGGTTFPNPKENSSISESISYSTFLGDSGIQKLKIDVNTDANFTHMPNQNNIKNITVTYENSELPFTSTYGNAHVTYKEGKFSFGGKYDYLDLQVDKWGKKFQESIKEGDAQTIAIAAGAVAAAGIGIWAATKYLPEPQTIPLPIKTKVYGNGALEIRVGIEPSLTLGQGKIAMDLHKGGMEVKHNIASGTNLREAASYDVDKKELSSEIEANYERTNVKVSNLYAFTNPDATKTYISMSKSHTIADGLNIGYGYSQELDRHFKPSNQSITLGVEYTPNDNWRFNLGTGISLPTPDGVKSYGLSARSTYKF